MTVALKRLYCVKNAFCVGNIKTIGIGGSKQKICVVVGGKVKLIGRGSAQIIMGSQIQYRLIEISHKDFKKD